MAAQHDRQVRDRFCSRAERCRDPHDESLWPNTGACARLRRIDRENGKAVARELNETLLAPLDDRLRGVIGVPVRVDSHPSASGVLDTIYSARAHGIAVPPVFEDREVTDRIESAVCAEWFSGYRNANGEFARLAMGRLLAELMGSFDRRIRLGDGDPLKLAVYAAHDTTVAGILNATHAFDGRWPRYTAHLSVELLERPPSSLFARLLGRSEHFVTMRYNAQPVRLPACAAVGAHLPGSDGTVCTLAAFRSAVDAVAMTDKEWEAACEAV